MYDVLIIGAGCVGSAIARELSRYKLSVAVLDKENDVSCGTSKANSGIIHGGYDAKYDTEKGRLSKRGNELFTTLSKELGFDIDRCGSLVLAFDDNDERLLRGLYENGLKNGLNDIYLVDGDFVKSREPYVNQSVTMALYSESAGVVSPYEYTIALMENAVANKTELFLNHEVKSITKENSNFRIEAGGDVFYSRVIINAAGVFADDVANMLAPSSFNIKAVRGEYMLFDKDEAHKANGIMFQTPSGNSKGVLVSPTIHRNLFVGPNYQQVDDKHDTSTHTDALNEILGKSKKSVPSIDPRKVITQFAGLRAVSESGDFIISQSEEVHGLINAAGICSPGLSTSYAIALKVRDILDGIIELKQRDDFEAYREKPIVVAELSEEELNSLIAKDAAYGRIVCRCERITEGEIVSCLKRGILVTDTDGVKRRVRAGMGRCQAGFCTQRILEILSRQTGQKVESITKNGGGSYVLNGRLFGEERKNDGK